MSGYRDGRKPGWANALDAAVAWSLGVPRTIVLGGGRLARVIWCKLCLDLLDLFMVADLRSKLQLLL